MKIADNEKNIVSPEYHPERLKEFLPIVLPEIKMKYKIPEFKPEVLVISAISAVLYVIAYQNMASIMGFFYQFKENAETSETAVPTSGISGYMGFFILIGAFITAITTVIRYIIGLIQRKKEENKIIKNFNPETWKAKSLEKSQEYIDNLNAVYPENEIQESALWCRTHHHKSFLQIRMGFCSQALNPCRVELWKDAETSEFPEKWNQKVQTLISETRLIHADENQELKIPYLLDFRTPAILGVTGASARQKEALLYQLLFFHSPAELTVHIYGNCCRSEHIISMYGKEKKNKPVFWFIDDYKKFCEDSPSNIYLLSETEGSVSAILFCENFSDLPSSCDMVYDMKNNLLSFRNSSQSVSVSPDAVSAETIQKQKSILENSEIPHDTQGLLSNYPVSVGLFTFHDIKDQHQIVSFHQKRIQEKYPAKLEIPIGNGIAGGNNHVCVDITSAKHGVMAGYTGSGKSQFLLSMMTSLSLYYHPDFVQFTFIDFKGGSSSEQLKHLPHFAGSFTDVDGTEKVIRVITILEQEGKRRQKILQSAFDKGYIEQMEITEYHKYLRNHPEDTSLEILPYLLIVIDEFTELMSQYHNFSKDLESIARLGRSRGMFLLLCAQRPFSSLNGQIRSNLGYTICLKTNSAEDSKNAIGTSDAFSLVHKGSGYLMTVENDNCVYFQSPYAMESAENSSQSQLSAISSALRNFYLKENFKQRLVFSQELPAVLNCNETEVLSQTSSFHYQQCKQCKWNGVFSGEIPVGEIDNVISQKRETAMLPVFDQNTIIYGNPSTGKTMALKTILMQVIKLCPPEQTDIFILNAGELSYSDFQDMPHISCIINPSYEEDTFLFQRFLLILERELKERKTTLKTESLEAYNQKNPDKVLKHLICIIDGFDFLKDEYPQAFEKLQDFIKKSGKTGISFIVTTRSTLPVVMKSQFQNIMIFQFREDAYRDILTLGAIKKPSPIRGRCLTNLSQQKLGLEMQVMLPVGTESTEEGFETAMFEEMRKQLSGIKLLYYHHHKYRARQIPVIPTDRISNTYNALYTPLTAVDEFIQKEEFQNAKYQVIMGIRTDTVKPFVTELSSWRMMTVLGTPHSGKTTALHHLIQPLLNKNQGNENNNIGMILIGGRNDSLIKNYQMGVNNVQCFSQSAETIRSLYQTEEGKESPNYQLLTEEMMKKYRLVLFVIDDYPQLLRIAEAENIKHMLGGLDKYLISNYQIHDNFKFIFSGNIGDCAQNTMFSNHEKNNLNLWIVGGVLSQLGTQYDSDNLFARYKTPLPEHYSIYRRMGEVISIKF